MKLLQLSILCITLLVCINNGIAQEFGVLIPSLEAIEPVFNNRSLAMGQTTITTPRGGSAIFSNPSILATFSAPQVQAGGKLLFGTIRDEAANERYDSYNATYEPSPNRSYLAFATPYNYKLSDTQLRLAFGIGYQRNEGAQSKIEIVDNGDRLNVTGTGRGLLSTLTPGVALNYQNRYFLGVTLNRALGAITETLETKRSDYHSKTDKEIKQSAQFFRLGAFGEVTPNLSISLMFRPEFEWELEDIITKTDENGEVETDRSSERVEYTIPTMWGIGAEYQVSPELIVALEVQSRPFSELQSSLDVNEQLIIDDGFNFAVGAEYLLGSTYPVRFGAFRDVIPFTDENDTAPLNLAGLTAGIGSDRDKDFSWDASVLYSGWEHVSDEGQKSSETLTRVSISVTYRFN